MLPAIDQAVGDDGVGAGVVVVERRLEIVEAAVFFGEAAVIVETKTCGDAEVGAELIFVLNVGAGFFGAVVAIGVALHEGAGDEAVRAVGGFESLHELRKVGEGDDAFVGALIARVELGVGEAAAEGDGVAADGPDGVGGRHEAILKNAGERALRV